MWGVIASLAFQGLGLYFGYKKEEALAKLEFSKNVILYKKALNDFLLKNQAEIFAKARKAYQKEASAYAFYLFKENFFKYLFVFVIIFLFLSHWLKDYVTNKKS